MDEEDVVKTDREYMKEYDAEWLGRQLDLPAGMATAALSRLIGEGLAESFDQAVRDELLTKKTPVSIDTQIFGDRIPKLSNVDLDYLYERVMEERKIRSDIHMKAAINRGSGLVLPGDAGA